MALLALGDQIMSGYLGAPSSVATNGNASMSIGTGLGSQLMELLNSEAICPGESPSYQLCKTIYAYHPLGAKMVDGPIRLAQSQERDISVPGSPESRVVDAFKQQWARRCRHSRHSACGAHLRHRFRGRRGEGAIDRLPP
jgi:hypothetical protein